MKVARAALVLFALAAGLLATPVHAADAALSLSLGQRWSTLGALGEWTAYEVTLQNDGSTGFTGDVSLVPARARGDQGGVSSWPTYQARVTVPPASVRSIAFYVVQAPAGYQAEVRDLGGHQVGTASVASTTSGAFAVGLLSDVRDGDSRIVSLRPLPSPFNLAVTRFSNAQAFPTSAVYLNGLQALVIDDFDSGSLSQAQVQTIRDFVGLGGSLILGGGASWRRTLQPLPQELLPLKPAASDVAGLAPLAEFGLLGPPFSGQQTQVVTGQLNGGREVLGSPLGAPLAVEGRYGAGRVVEVTYDPFAPPFDSDAALASLSWAHSLIRGLSDQSAGGRGFGGPGGLSLAGSPAVYVSAVTPAGSAAGGPTTAAVAPPTSLGQGAVDAQISSLLRSNSDASLPPLGLIAGLLVGYVLLVGPLLYLALRAIRRRELAWVAVPALAVLFTGIAYGTGIGSRGSQFVDNAVEIQRLAPGGAVETRAYHGIFAPHRGAYAVRVPANTLVSTVLGGFDAMPNLGQTATIASGVRSEVQVANAAVWGMQTVQTLSIGHGQIAIDSHLKVEQGRIKGTITNRTPWPLERITLQAGSATTAQGGQRAALAPSLAPGATATVDAPLVAPGAATLPGLKGVPGQPASDPTTGVDPTDKKSVVLGIGLYRAIILNPAQYSLVAVSVPGSSLEVEGRPPSRSAVAALVAPVTMDSIDTLPAVRPARIVSSYTVLPRYVDVYDLEVPAGVTGPLKLSYSLPPLPAGTYVDRTGTSSMDIYDWSLGSWIPLPRQSGAAVAAISLPPGKTLGGIARIRVVESNPNGSGSNVKLVAGP